MQAAARENFAGNGMLTGSPVNAVYLRVGDKKEWLLKYCVPAGEASHSTYQINIGDSSPLTAPYPISTSIPTDMLGQSFQEQILLHGVLRQVAH